MQCSTCTAWKHSVVSGLRTAKSANICKVLCWMLNARKCQQWKMARNDANVRVSNQIVSCFRESPAKLSAQRALAATEPPKSSSNTEITNAKKQLKKFIEMSHGLAKSKKKLGLAQKLQTSFYLGKWRRLLRWFEVTDNSRPKEIPKIWF